MSTVNKQISIFVPIADWKLIRQTVANRGIPMTVLVMGWIKPELDKVKANGDTEVETETES